MTNEKEMTLNAAMTLLALQKDFLIEMIGSNQEKKDKINDEIIHQKGKFLASNNIDLKFESKIPSLFDEFLIQPVKENHY